MFSTIWKKLCFFFFVFFLLFFGATPVAYGGSQARGQIGAVATGLCPEQCQIWAASATCTTDHSNAGCLTYWARPRTEPVSSWILVRFISIEPQQELLMKICNLGFSLSCFSRCYGHWLPPAFRTFLPVTCRWCNMTVCILRFGASEQRTLKYLMHRKERTGIIFLSLSLTNYSINWPILTQCTW